ncbi:hypothetical protein GCM10022215_27710 [Nocardioides fonticola]|uniref:Thioredoxin domain-containing protein n=1 Tax=Nocardioides fonticola TaxID=450363 RepID=A0ABP7XMR7_9ACTN
MARLRVAALAAVVLLAVATACAPGTQTPVVGSGGVRPAAIDVDTPALRQAKQDAGIAPCRPGDAAPASEGLPDLTLPCFGGGQDVDLATLRGPLLVNVWSVNCGPCRTEMPILQRFHEKYGDRVGVLGIDFQDVQTEAAMKLAVRSGVTYPLVADTQGALATADPVRLRALPTTAMVDADGRVVHVQAVEYKSLDQLVEAVRQHLGIDL